MTRRPRARGSRRWWTQRDGCDSAGRRSGRCLLEGCCALSGACWCWRWRCERRGEAAGATAAGAARWCACVGAAAGLRHAETRAVSQVSACESSAEMVRRIVRGGAAHRARWHGGRGRGRCAAGGKGITGAISQAGASAAVCWRVLCARRRVLSLASAVWAESFGGGGGGSVALLLWS